MRSRTLLVAGIGAALITLAGCGGTSIGGSASPLGAGGAPKIVSVADLGALVQHNASGKNAAHLQLAMTIPGVGNITAAGDMRFAGAQSAEQMTMTLPGMGDLQTVMVGKIVYLKIPAGLAGLAGGSTTKPWTKIDLNSSGALSSLGSTANFADQADPTQLINHIAQSGTITSVKSETLDGVATQHYAITVDVQKMIATMGAGSAAEQQALAGIGAKSMPFDIWVNSDNLPVKITTKLALPGMTGGGASEADMTVTYSNWGESVNIQPPPADQVGG